MTAAVSEFPPPHAVMVRTKLTHLVWPLLLTMVLMLLLRVASVLTTASLRAYVNGEGRWSKAERHAIAELHRYS